VSETGVIAAGRNVDSKRSYPRVQYVRQLKRALKRAATRTITSK